MMQLILGVLFCIFLIGIVIYYLYTYYIYKYKSTERQLHITEIREIRTSRLFHQYCVAGEFTDMPGETACSCEFYMLNKQKHFEGDTIAVRYIEGNRFMIEPEMFLKNAIFLALFDIVAIYVVYVKFRRSA